MPEQKKQKGTDQTVGFDRSRLPINPEAEQNPAQDEMDGRNSQRLSADLPYGLPTDDTHPTGTPATAVSSGFSDLKRDQMPHIEDDNAQHDKGEKMADDSRNQSPSSSGESEAERRRKEPTYDAEKEIPDPEQVERDRADAERQYGEQKKSA